MKNMLRGATRFIRALMLLALLAGVSAGLPWGLWHYFGLPLPGHVPAYGDIKDWLNQARLSPDQAAVQVLDIAAWGYWALFTAQIAMQLPGVAADTARALRTRAPLPMADHPNLAGRLLFTIAISVIATRGTVAAASAAAATGSPAPPSPGTITDATVTGTVHVVVEGDSLWDIAKEHLGDPRRWREIYELNRHRVQSDGGVLTNPEVIRPGWVFVLPHDSEVQAPVVPASRVSALAVSSPPAASGHSPAPVSETHQVPSVVRRPVAVDLPTGGYVSLTLGAGLAAALAAISVRARVNGRRRAFDESHLQAERPGEPEATLLQAAASLGYGRDAETDPYIDDPSDDVPPIPQALSALRAPIAAYIGNRHGDPIPLQPVAARGLGLLGDGAHDAARALLASALAAGGFLAGSAVYQVITTADDLIALTGTKISGHVSDRLAVYDSLEEALAAVAAPSYRGGEQRPLLLATASTVAALTAAKCGKIEYVLLGCSDAPTIAEIDSAGIITASGVGASALHRAQAYRLSLTEAQTLMDHLVAASPAAQPEIVASDVPDQESLPGEPELLDSAEPATTEADLPEPLPATVIPPPIPSQASGAAPAAPEASLSINVLGPLQVKAAGRDVTALFRPLTAAILIQLALNPRGITRAALASDLWPEPDLDPDARAKRFKATLSHVRTALAEADGAKADHIQEARPSRLLTLNPDLVTVDAWRFDELLNTTGSAIGPQQPEHSALLEAIALHRGPIAHGHEHTDPKRNTDGAWLAPHRDDYLHKLVDAHTDAAEQLRPTDPDHAIDLLQRAAELEPWNHALSERIIEVHVEQGQRHAAARRLSVLTDHLAHLGMRPSPKIVGMVGLVALEAPR